MGVGWCGEVADARAALEHAGQAVRYLLAGKDDCVRKATKARCSPPSPSGNYSGPKAHLSSRLPLLCNKQEGRLRQELPC